jgi:succinate dehydrogenase/fumarate reductase cytochrome b subunit
MRIHRITAVIAAAFLAIGVMSSASAQPASGNLSIEDMPGT